MSVLTVLTLVRMRKRSRKKEKNRLMGDTDGGRYFSFCTVRACVRRKELLRTGKTCGRRERIAALLSALTEKRREETGNRGAFPCSVPHRETPRREPVLSKAL